MTRTRLYTSAAVAALLLAWLPSCTIKEDKPVKEKDARISFNAPVTSRPLSRAVTDQEIGKEYDTAESFTVWAVHDLEGARSFYMGTAGSGVKCVYKEAADAPEGLTGWYPVDSEGNMLTYYWPYQGTLSFRALSPADAGGAAALDVSDCKLTLTGFTVPEAGKQYDLMVSDLSHGWVGADFTGGDNDDNSTYIYNGVDILFRHALSGVEFRGRLASGEMASDIVVKEVRLSGLYDKGTLSATDVLVWSDLESSTGTPVEYNAFSGYAHLEYKPDGSSASLKSHTLMLLPQQLSRGDADGDKVRVKITYTRDGTETSVTETLYGLLGSEGGVGVSKAINEWLPGKKYVYTFVIGEDRMFFDPTVVDFKDWGGELDIK